MDVCVSLWVPVFAFCVSLGKSMDISMEEQMSLLNEEVEVAWASVQKPALPDTYANDRDMAAIYRYFKDKSLEEIDPEDEMIEYESPFLYLSPSESACYLLPYLRYALDFKRHVRSHWKMPSDFPMIVLVDCLSTVGSVTVTCNQAKCIAKFLRLVSDWPKYFFIKTERGELQRIADEWDTFALSILI